MATELQLIKSESFGDVQADIYSDGEAMCMTARQLSECLGYADKSGLDKIISRNPYIKESEFSGTVVLSVPQGSGYSTQETRVFNEDGIYEVTFLAKTHAAKQFRAWVRTILKNLRKGELQLSNNSVSLSPQVIEYKMQQLLHYSEQMMIENKELKSDVSFIKSQLLKITPAPKYTDWKREVNGKIKALAEATQTTHKDCLHQTYLSFKESGYDLNGMKKQYCVENGIVNCTTLDFIESNDDLREAFTLFVDNMMTRLNINTLATSLTTVILPQYCDPIRDTITPLIEKYKDTSTGGNVTYRKVYTAMNVGWSNRQTRYKKLHNLKNAPKKITLIKNDEKLLKLFKKTVNKMLDEQNEITTKG